MGFNFAFVDEAHKFQRAIIRAINCLNDLDSQMVKNNNNNRITINYNPRPRSFSEITKSAKKKADKKLIDKNLIGNPIGFVHVNHIGLSENNSFNVIIFFEVFKWQIFCKTKGI